MFLFGIILFLLIVVVTILSGTTGGVFIHLPSIIFVIAANIALIVATSSIGDFIYGVKISINREKEIEQVKLMEAIKVFEFLQRSCLGISLLGVSLGIISALSKVDDPSSIGLFLAAPLLIMFYNILLLVMIITPIKHILNKVNRSIVTENH